jgi:hypothetical protein
MGALMADSNSNVQSSKATRFVTHAATVALSGLVAWGTTVYLEYKKSEVEQGRYSLELEKDKVEIIDLVKGRETPLALALVDYYQVRFGGDSAYARFLEAIGAYINTAPGRISEHRTPSSENPNEVSGITIDDVRNHLFSVARRQFAEHVVDLYTAANEEGRRRLVFMLLEAIIPAGKDETRRYRVNLYIALTFSLLPRVAMTPEQITQLKALSTSHEYGDHTFKTNVNNAIAKQATT